MFAYTVRRLISGLVLLLVMTLITFVLFFSSPVDPARFTCGKNCTPALIEQNRKALGYDEPVLVQWADFLKGIFAGRTYPDDEALQKAAPEQVIECPAPCLGYSPKSNTLVLDEIQSRAPISASLAIAAFLMWIIGGVTLGATAALLKGTVVDRAIVGMTLFFFAFPTFFIGLFLYTYVALKWELVPLPVYTPIAEGGFTAWLTCLILPATTLALFYLAGYVRMTRAFVLESMGEDYLRTAKAKGLEKRRILFKHTMRAALTPLVTLAGLDLASLLGGAIITETVFNYQGLGALAADSARNYDLPMTVGIVIVLSSLVIVSNIIVDILYAFIDPRVRVG